MKLEIPKEGGKCRYCGKGTLVLRQSEYGDFLGCDRYPSCAGKHGFSKAMSSLEKETNKFLRQN
jgi:ssDNA-binding Zn-finger/Zn-ribbon topoisomerase 1